MTNNFPIHNSTLIRPLPRNAGFFSLVKKFSPRLSGAEVRPLASERVNQLLKYALLTERSATLFEEAAEFLPSGNRVLAESAPPFKLSA